MGWALVACLAGLGAIGAIGAGCNEDDPTGLVDPNDIDRMDPSCKGGPRLASTCGEPTIRHDELPAGVTAKHIPDNEPIVYPIEPPTLGDHRGVWAKWGEYSYLPPQRFVHNMEHGGIVFLYDPCVPDLVVNALRTFARGFAGDASGDFRWVMTPYPGLDTPVAVLAWGWAWRSDCVDVDAMTTFIRAHYRQATEDVPHPGTYDTGWIGD